MKAKHLTVFPMIIACIAIVGPQAAQAAHSRPRHRGGHHHTYGFAVLGHRSGKISDASAQRLGMPSSAVLAQSIPGDKFYVGQKVDGNETKMCVADEEASGSGGTACGSTASAERQGLGLIYPSVGGNDRLVVLVPNGVKTVTVTTSNSGNVAVTVINNVAVVDGNLTAYHFTAPSGASVSVPLEHV